MVGVVTTSEIKTLIGPWLPLKRTCASLASLLKREQLRATLKIVQGTTELTRNGAPAFTWFPCLRHDVEATGLATTVATLNDLSTLLVTAGYRARSR